MPNISRRTDLTTFRQQILTAWGQHRHHLRYDPRYRHALITGTVTVFRQRTIGRRVRALAGLVTELVALVSDGRAGLERPSETTTHQSLGTRRGSSHEWS